MTSSPFLEACRRRAVPFTPVWLMRQAGRYMPEYRSVRSRYSFLDLCKDSDAAAEVTVTAVERLGVDAAIIFADILLIVEPLGVGLEFAKGDGPVLHNPLRTPDDIDRMPDVDAAAAVPFVYDAVRKARAELKVPLIGFSGAPFTLASYVIEGGGSRNYVHTKSLMYGAPEAWHTLMRRLSKAIVAYLNGQIAAGAQAVQLFDSWVGCLSPADYERFVVPHMQELIGSITPGVPVIHFGTGTGGLLELMRRGGGDVIGVDWRIDLDVAWKRLGYDVAVQGNLDPIVLFAPLDEIRAQVRRIIDAIEGHDGHIFNLGHGILPNTPVDNVIALVDMVHEISAR
ncbi:MAG TPA: uroporphyrinogen decarboxylase [Candidatus Acidoferrales bacterium]|nr:uroporphyrinogen decarboxylase [Candidatus Acidoferrales bacterium]